MRKCMRSKSVLMKKHVPNIFTCLNLFCGCVAVVMVFRNRLDTASYLVFLAVLFDFFDERQAESFIGLPTPANTLLIISLPLILHYDYFHLTGLIRNPYFIVILSVVLSYLLIAEIPLFSLKFKSFAWKENRYQYTLLA